jgi:uncharacterized membrane protein YfcA
VAPNWPAGIALGAGGLLGACLGARLQSRLPDQLIRRLLGVLEVAIGFRFLLAGLLWLPAVRMPRKGQASISTVPVLLMS